MQILNLKRERKRETQRERKRERERGEREGKEDCLKLHSFWLIDFSSQRRLSRHYARFRLEIRDTENTATRVLISSSLPPPALVPLEKSVPELGK